MQRNIYRAIQAGRVTGWMQPVPRLRQLILGIGAGLCLAGGVRAGLPQQHAAQPGVAAAARAGSDDQACAKCHSQEVAGYERSRMAHSMRLGGREPAGVVLAPDATIRMYSDGSGSWQSRRSQGITSTYHVDFVIGAGAHADGYVTTLDGHLFQSPVAYYVQRSAYGLAPGYESGADPDFTRPVTPGCLFCHSGSFKSVEGTINQYAAVPFSHLTIGCERCHGPTAAHLKDPNFSNIVDPARLKPAARDSICEQCHLKGVVRVLNPGKQFTDFVAGQPLEDTFTIYHNVMAKGVLPPFHVISQSEQLALSLCKRRSGEAMWCGTCHDPHDEPVDPVSYYRARCLTCHAQTKFAADHPSKTSNCIGCHMPRKEAQDGGHTVFTDHRIQRIPTYQNTAKPVDIAPWREPPASLVERNLGIALVETGLGKDSPEQIVRGYRMLVEVQTQFPQDSDMFNAIGDALFAGGQYGEAAQAFDLAVRFDNNSSTKLASLGSALAALEEPGPAEEDLERALTLDPLNLSAATRLIDLYTRSNQKAKADALSNRIEKLIRSGAGHDRGD